jgi:hypothetical protein
MSLKDLSKAEFDCFFNHAKMTDLAAITREQVIAWRDALVASGLSGSTIAKVHLTALKRICTLAQVNARIGVDSSAGVKIAKPKKIKVREQGFTLEEAETILSTLQPAGDRPRRSFKRHGGGSLKAAPNSLESYSRDSIVPPDGMKSVMDMLKQLDPELKDATVDLSATFDDCLVKQAAT